MSPLPGRQSNNGADHDGEPEGIEQHEAGDNQWRQDDTGDETLLEHQDSAATCSLVLPKRRCRRAKSASASRMASCLKSGQYRSEKYSSAYASCHSRKLLIRRSPPVRM